MVKMGLKELILAGILAYQPNLEARDFKEGNSVVQKSGIYWTKEGEYWSQRDQDSWFINKSRDRPKFRELLESELNKGAKLVEKDHNLEGKRFVENFRKSLPYIPIDKEGNELINTDGKIKGEEEATLYVSALKSTGMRDQDIVGIATDGKIDSTELMQIINHAYLNKDPEFSYMQQEIAKFAKNRLTKSKLSEKAKDYLGIYAMYPEQVHRFFAASNKLTENIEINLTDKITEPVFIHGNFNSDKAQLINRKYKKVENKDLVNAANMITSEFYKLDSKTKSNIRHIARDYKSRTNDTLKVMSPHVTIFLRGNNYKILIDKPKENKLTLKLSN